MKSLLNFTLSLVVTSLMTMNIYAADQAPQTVGYVDIQKYMGTWYEIAKFPAWFQNKCAATRAIYSLQSNGTVAVKNQCIDINNPSYTREANGTAFVDDKTTNAKLKVSFVPLLQVFGWFAGDYWILALGEDYQFVLVGSPDRNYLWFLSRSKEMDPQIFEELKDIAIREGFDLSRLTLTKKWP
ncbi:MAG: lipocalin family protein [Oligoflexia bacterium]|nr:lipocalin family protein [Oligoflexia bacterium]